MLRTSFLNIFLSDGIKLDLSIAFISSNLSNKAFSLTSLELLSCETATKEDFEAIAEFD